MANNLRGGDVWECTSAAALQTDGAEIMKIYFLAGAADKTLILDDAAGVTRVSISTYTLKWCDINFPIPLKMTGITINTIGAGIAYIYLKPKA